MTDMSGMGHSEVSRVSEVSLAQRTSFRIGGAAREFYAPSTVQDLSDLLEDLAACGRTPFILGGGTNTLFPDEDFSRPIVSTENLRKVVREGDVLRAEAGAQLSGLVQSAIGFGLSGLEGLVGIPGTVGGAAFMNAGGKGWNVGDRVESIEVLPLCGGPLRRLKGSEVTWGYRSSGLERFVVTQVSLALTPVAPAALKSRARQLYAEKRGSQPLGVPSAGCVFRNPPGLVAARLIEQLGLKGLSIGGARISEQHANFIVNATGHARASDVIRLLDEVRARVLDAFGVRLETEIVLA